MLTKIHLSELPCLAFSQLDRLPIVSAIYIVFDSDNRVHYVGKASNLYARWRDHHRLKQLQKINRKNPLKISWLVCSNDEVLLTKTENFLIEYYQPLLNRTPVPSQKIIPSERILQQTLSKIAKYALIFGIEEKYNSSPTTVYLKYSCWATKCRTGTLRTIFKADNKKPTSLRWREYDRLKYGASWQASCNGVNLNVSPLLWDDIQRFQKEAILKRLAGIEMLAMQEPEFRFILSNIPHLNEKKPGLSVFKDDPIPLVWLNY